MPIAQWKVLGIGALLLRSAIPAEGGMQQPRTEKRFFTEPGLDNKAYSNPFAKIKDDDIEICESRCKQKKECFAFAYSSFAMVCQLFKHTPGMIPVLQNSYQLYVIERSPEDGFHKWGTNYIKLYYERVSAYEAQDFCKNKMGGSLVTPTDENMNKFLKDLILNEFIFYAYIGVTDEKDERKWRYFNGEPAKYQNWLYKGEWRRKDQNCVLITPKNGQWKQTDCRSNYPFICQIPFY